jgi:hypothetical protein
LCEHALLCFAKQLRDGRYLALRRPQNGIHHQRDVAPDFVRTANELLAMKQTIANAANTVLEQL